MSATTTEESAPGPPDALSIERSPPPSIRSRLRIDRDCGWRAPFAVVIAVCECPYVPVRVCVCAYSVSACLRAVVWMRR